MGLWRQPSIWVVANRRSLSPSPHISQSRLTGTPQPLPQKISKPKKQDKNFTEISKEGLS